jgi:hypothetical protein
MGRNEDRQAGTEESLPVRDDGPEREGPAPDARPASGQETAPAAGVERQRPSDAAETAGEENVPTPREIDTARQTGGA